VVPRPSGSTRLMERSFKLTEFREQIVDSDFCEPEGTLETAVAKIEAEILEVDRIGRTDSFYDFGGTSLKAIRICARIERETGYRALPLWLFDTDVLADFVQRLEVEGAPSQ
jgi:Phosphopantetheine attachment site